jgi:hypothetical protein
MEYQVYAIKDELAGTFGNLMVINEKVADRTVRWMAQEMEKADCEDKRVYLLGSYDNETGLIRTEQLPRLIYNLELIKKEQMNGSQNL